MEKMLYYYCSPQVFESILKNKELWLSEVTKSNDYAEVKFFLKRLLKRLNERIQYLDATSKRDIPTKKLYKDAYDMVEGLITIGYYFAICFGASSDSLVLWREYAKSGQGFAIGMEEKKVFDYFKELGNNKLCIMQDVCYDKEARKKAIDGLMKDLKDLIKHIKTSKDEEKEKRILEWSRKVAFEAIHYKDSDFSVEQETRLCYTRTITDKQILEESQKTESESHLQYVEYRVTENNCIPYMKFPFDGRLDLISKVVIGPENQSDANIIKLMLARYGFPDGVTVEKSKITYRTR